MEGELGYFFRILYCLAILLEGVLNLLIGLLGFKYWCSVSTNLLIEYHYRKISNYIGKRELGRANSAEKAIKTIKAQLDKDG